MKRGTPDHPKTVSLAAGLKDHLSAKGHDLALELCQTMAVGILEKLWHFAARYAPAGDVGKHGNPSIAAAIGWPYDPAWIVEQLVTCKLLDDTLNGVRLYVHDWHDHSDEAADKYLAAQGLLYANGRQPRKGKKSRQFERSADLSRLSKSKSDPESDPNPQSESVAANDGFLGWVTWWNKLAAQGLVAATAAVNPAQPSKEALDGWERIQRDQTLRLLLNDRESIEREIATSRVCRGEWFTIGKLFGGWNAGGEVVLHKLLAGKFRDHEQNGKPIVAQRRPVTSITRPPEPQQPEHP